MAPTVYTMSYPSGSRSSGDTKLGFPPSSGDSQDKYLGHPQNGLPANKSGSTGLSTVKSSPTRNLKDNETKYRTEFFKKEPCPYSHQVIKHAAVIFDALKHEKTAENPYQRRKQEEERRNNTPEIPHIDFDNAKDKKLAFELAFQTLKYQTLLEEMLEEVSFFSVFPEHREDEGIVMVALQDFQTRKFQTRHYAVGDTIDPDVRLIDDAILSSSVKLNASLARNRIRHQVASIDHLLPLAVRETEVSSNVPAYLWVNTNKTSLHTVNERLAADGYVQVSPTADLQGHMFCVDPHCDDLLTFSPAAREDIVTHDLVTDGALMLQDKSSCYGPHTVRYLMNDGDDVIHVNVGSGATTAHLSSLLGKKTNHVWAFGSQSDEQTAHAKRCLERLKAKNVKLLPDSFLDTSPEDPRLKNAKVVLISAECSKSGIGNPVDFVVSEGEDMTILKELSTGQTDSSKLSKLIAQQGAVLKHAMRMSKVQAIVYCTRSINEAENEAAIVRAMEYANTALLKKVPYRVAPPVLPFSSEDIDNGNILDGRYIKVKPTSYTNGCFVALITREPEEMQETAKDILERAAAKGLLGPKVKAKKQRDAVEEKHHDDSPRQTPEQAASINNHIDVREKLLHRRVRKPQQKISPAPRSTPAPNLKVAAKVHTHNAGYKGSGSSVGHGRFTPTRHTSTRTSESVVSRLYQPRALKTPSTSSSQQPPKHKSFIEEYRRVVKHPAPFR